jgi:integrase
MVLCTTKYDLTKKEQTLLLQALKGLNDKCFYLFCQVALSSGGRISEILGLKREDIAFINADNVDVTFTKTKNKKTRKAYIFPSLANKLLRHR